MPFFSKWNEGLNDWSVIRSGPLGSFVGPEKNSSFQPLSWTLDMGQTVGKCIGDISVPFVT